MDRTVYFVLDYYRQGLVHFEILFRVAGHWGKFPLHVFRVVQKISKMFRLGSCICSGV